MPVTGLHYMLEARQASQHKFTSSKQVCILWHHPFMLPLVEQVLVSVGEGGLMRVAIILCSCLPTSSLLILPTGGGLSLLTGTPSLSHLCCPAFTDWQQLVCAVSSQDTKSIFFSYGRLNGSVFDGICRMAKTPTPCILLGINLAKVLVSILFIMRCCVADKLLQSIDILNRHKISGTIAKTYKGMDLAEVQI